MARTMTLVRAHILAVPERNCEYDLGIARHKARKGACLVSLRLAVTSLRVFVCSDQCRPYAGGARPHYMQHRHRIVSSCHAEPNGPFVFISVQRTNLPFGRCYRPSLSLSLALLLSLFSSLSLFLSPARLFSLFSSSFLISFLLI